MNRWFSSWWVCCAICTKEFKSFLFSPGYFVTIGIFFALISYTYLISFYNFIEAIQQAPASPFGGPPMNFHDRVILSHIHLLNLLFIFMIPVIISRIMSEDKKLYSFNLLMTSPLTSTSIVSGKFWGGLFAVWFIILITMLYPLASSMFVDIQWGKFFSAYLGLLLIAGVYSSVAFFCSSFTDSVVLATISGIVLNLGFLIISFFSVFYKGSTFTAFLEHISLNRHLTDFTQGNLGLSSVIFCVTTMLLFCFLSERIVESARWRA